MLIFDFFIQLQNNTTLFLVILHKYKPKFNQLKLPKNPPYNLLYTIGKLHVYS